jgi:hypothetical protein
MPKKKKQLTDREKVDKWLKDHPKKAMIIASNAVRDLYFPEGSGAILTEDEDFPSGADYIDEVCVTLRAVGLGAVLEQLQQDAEGYL